MIDNDNCGCTPPPVKGHWECTPIPDTCKPVELTDKLVKEMYENNINTEAFTTIEKAQLAVLHGNVGGPNGAIKEIVAGSNISVNNTNPTKPIISTLGVSGPQGPQGPQGDQGIQGTTGIQGPKGKDGIDGVSWRLAGRDTEANIMTKTGAPGDMWIIKEPTNPKDGHAIGWDPTLTPAGWKDMGQFKGDKGDQGTAGTNGSKGATGSTGTKGDQGIAGPKGSVGPKGSEGPQGPIGVTGAVGGQGIQGGKGDKGDAGKNGTGITVKGSKADETAIKLLTGSTAGDMWIAKDTGHGWVSDGATPTVWTDAGDIQGPKGDTGTVGPQGVVGPKGDTGATGPKGDTGLNGSDGSDGTQGHTGPIGLTGPAGATGNPGPAGQWGQDGATGSTGPKGATGSIGPQGNPGPQGSKGDKGDSGVVGYATDQETQDGIIDNKAVTPKSAKASYVPVGGGVYTGAVTIPTIVTAGVIAGYDTLGAKDWFVGRLGTNVALGEFKAGGARIVVSDDGDMTLQTTTGKKAYVNKDEIVTEANGIKISGGVGRIVGAGTVNNAQIRAYGSGGGEIGTFGYSGTYHSMVLTNKVGRCEIKALDNGNIELSPRHGRKATVAGDNIVTGELSGTHLKLFL